MAAVIKFIAKVLFNSRIMFRALVACKAHPNLEQLAQAYEGLSHPKISQFETVIIL